MNELVISTDELGQLRSELMDSSDERVAVLFAAQARRSEEVTRLLVRDSVFPTETDYSRNGIDHAELKPDFVARVTMKARRENLSLIFVHTHPGDSPPHFSPIDDQGETKLSAFLTHRAPDTYHAALVISKGGLCARLLGSKEYLRVISVGPRRVVEFDPSAEGEINLNVFDRQIRAFGSDGQRNLQRLRIAIVGLGRHGINPGSATRSSWNPRLHPN